MKNVIQSYISQNSQQMLGVIKDLCGIPAPSGFEHERAVYCKKWLDGMGAQGVYMDDALNVIFPLHCEESNEITVFAAHTDTVFPDVKPMPYFDDGEKIHCPGVADNTASVAVLMMMAKFFVENEIIPQKGFLFVCNSCEEGLGNLKGTRQLFDDYRGRISRFISFDSVMNIVNDRCVGSHRYEVEVLTEGGHSFGDFGKCNAIAKLSEIVSEIYKIKVPDKELSHTTYNVGEISGGTSVNTIAQNAKMLCEYRSDDKECLAMMQAQFIEIFEAAETDNVKICVKRVGDRPCGNVENSKLQALKQTVVPIIEGVLHDKITLRSSSTDCNIPLSLGVPALCVGVSEYAGMHTREEWLDKASLTSGLEIAIRLGKAFVE
ncbi:MAG: M20/M25/M40 family metallo-hydrolase [Clostridia bacterium]|nr:M20/M25/M40 family metallo-hydrolase [Clostridia bacterium]